MSAAFMRTRLLPFLRAQANEPAQMRPAECRAQRWRLTACLNEAATLARFEQ
jgi:hypothetical protein